VVKMRYASVYFSLRPGFIGIGWQKLLDVRDHCILWVGDFAVVGWKRINRYTGDTLLAVSPGLLDHIQDRALASDLYLPALGIKLM
jgi:hypothetical protein